MSMYLHGFIRSKSDDFIPLFCVSRASELFNTFSHNVPYEGIRAMTEVELREIKSEIKEAISEKKALLNEYGVQKDFIRSANNSLDDKMEYYHDINREIEELKEYIDGLQAIVDLICFLMMVIAENKEYAYDDYESPRPNDELIYMGIECGSHVTVNDIK